MSGELRWAVTDGPAGTKAVALPEDCLDARRLRRHYSGLFWCSTQAGGCGRRLVLHAADEIRPSFRHPGDARCPLLGRADVGRAYDHLRYRGALAAWLTGLELRSRVSSVPGRDGAAGLHVAVDEVGAALEVQLSPLPDTSWRARDDALRRGVRHVTWFYGPAAGPAAATEAAVRGVSFELRRHDVGLSVGVRDVDDRTRWVRLAVCRLTVDGFWAPGTEEARALHARRSAHRQEAARRVAHEAVRTASTRPWDSLLSPLPFRDEDGGSDIVGGTRPRRRGR